MVTEDTKTRHNWVPFGIYMQDDFYAAITQTFSTSTTHAACIEGVGDLIFGKGLYSKNEEFQQRLNQINSARRNKESSL